MTDPVTQILAIAVLAVLCVSFARNWRRRGNTGGSASDGGMSYLWSGPDRGSSGGDSSCGGDGSSGGCG